MLQIAAPGSDREEPEMSEALPENLAARKANGVRAARAMFRG